MSEGTGRRARRWSIGTAVDQFFFVFAGLAAIWLAYLSFTETFAIGWWGIAAGWVRADPVTVGTSWRIVSSTLRRRSYDEALVSPLFLFGRQQDFAYQQEVDGSPEKRHHVRFWRCPDGWLLPGGRRVDWLAAGTFDTSVGLSLCGGDSIRTDGDLPIVDVRQVTA